MPTGTSVKLCYMPRNLEGQGQLQSCVHDKETWEGPHLLPLADLEALYKQNVYTKG